MNKKRVLASIIGIIAVVLLLASNKVNATTAKVTTETLNLRKEASTNSSIVELLSENDELEVIGQEDNGWYHVKHEDKEGYVSADYVKVTKTETTTEPVTKTETIEEYGSQTTIETGKNTEIIETLTIVTLSKSTKLRILPLVNSQVLDVIPKGTEVDVVSETNNWLFIQKDNFAGWIVKNAVEEYTTNTTTSEISNVETLTENKEQENEEKDNEKQSNEEQEEQLEENATQNYTTSQTKYVNGSSVYMRKSPSTSAEIVTILIKNTDVQVTGEDGDWYKVEYGSYSGYIYKSLLSESKQEETNRSGINISRLTENEEELEIETTSTSSLGEEIVAYAKQYLGCPYVYGGSGPSSFDCSGFTMYVYKNFGYSFSHSATAQSQQGQYVSKEDLQPGDLVFFADYETMEGIGHCGIYIGEGNFIHASSGTGYCVKISTLTSGSYLNRYVTARRII